MKTAAFDSSNHTVEASTSCNEPLSPRSPNSVGRFPDETNVLPSSMKCLLPSQSPVTNDADAVAEADVDVDVNVDVDFDFDFDCDDSDVHLEDYETCSSSSSSSHTTSRRVHFSPLVRVKDTWSHHDMTLKEHYDYWIQDHEYLMIKQRNQQTIQSIEAASNDEHDDFGNNNSNTHRTVSSCSDNDNDHCLRGLETGFRNECLRRRSYRFAAMEEVFLEQEDQYYAGIYDDEAIAEVYFEVTGECRFRAEFRALQDRKEIEDYIISVVVVLAVATGVQRGVRKSQDNLHEDPINSCCDEDEFAI